MRTVTLSFDIKSETTSEFLTDCAKAARALEDAGFVVNDIHGVDNTGKNDDETDRAELVDDRVELINDLDRHAIKNFGDDVSAATIDRLLDFSAQHRYDPNSPEGVLVSLGLRKESEETT